MHRILGKGFECSPINIPLNQERFKSLNQSDLNNLLNKIHSENGVSWSISGDRENRVDLYRQNENIMREGRTVHIGVDIIAPAGTPLHSPIDAEVFHVEYDAGAGNYGWFCVLKGLVDGKTIYLLFGHLAEKNLTPVGTRLSAGDVFACIGDFSENGNWFHHTHVQAITQKGIDEGWMYKGLCTKKQLAEIDELCPSAMQFIKI